MIDSFGIYKKANALVKRIGTRDTRQIANELGIKIYYENYDDLLGMYTVDCQVKLTTFYK